MKRIGRWASGIVEDFLYDRGWIRLTEDEQLWLYRRREAELLKHWVGIMKREHERLPVIPTAEVRVD